MRFAGVDVDGEPAGRRPALPVRGEASPTGAGVMRSTTPAGGVQSEETAAAVPVRVDNAPGGQSPSWRMRAK